MTSTPLVAAFCPHLAGTAYAEKAEAVLRQLGYALEPELATSRGAARTRELNAYDRSTLEVALTRFGLAHSLPPYPA